MIKPIARAVGIAMPVSNIALGIVSLLIVVGITAKGVNPAPTHAQGLTVVQPRILPGHAPGQAIIMWNASLPHYRVGWAKTEVLQAETHEIYYGDWLDAFNLRDVFIKASVSLPTITMTGLEPNTEYAVIVAPISANPNQPAGYYQSLFTTSDTPATALPDAGDVATDRAVLSAIYRATGGANWGNYYNAGWLTDAPLNEWWGVATDAEGRVIAILLGHQHGPPGIAAHHMPMAGSIPPDVGNLSRLQILNIGSASDNNRLVGTIPPELGNLSRLRQLSLSGNSLSAPIPPELGNLASLEMLHIDNEQPLGEIPPELGNLSNLTSLALIANLKGPIPPNLGHLSNLENIFLYYNRLTGPIPHQLGKLTRLQKLYLCSNELTGRIPRTLGNLRELEQLCLSINQLSDAVPTQLVNLGNLDHLYLSGNQFTGCLPQALVNIPNHDLDSLGLPYCEQP